MPPVISEMQNGIGDTRLGRMLRMNEVEWLTGRKKTAIYVDIKAKAFPAPVQIGSRAVAWREEDIRAWMSNLKPVGEK